MKGYFLKAMREAAPYGAYLVFFALVAGLLSVVWESMPTVVSILMGMFLVGVSASAVIAGWRFAMAFNPKPSRAGAEDDTYLRLEKFDDAMTLAERLFAYQGNLRRVVLSHIRGRRRLTSWGLAVAVALLLVPVTTWAVILFRAFGQQEELPNAWLLVVSSTSAGALGLAIAVSMLRHVKNSQIVLSSLESRLLDAVEAGIAMESQDLTEDQRARAISVYLSDLCRRRGLASEPDDSHRMEQVERDFLLGVATQGAGQLLSR